VEGALRSGERLAAMLLDTLRTEHLRTEHPAD
jgi:hypothetical protein